jgi:hypothetical protein
VRTAGAEVPNSATCRAIQAIFAASGDGYFNTAEAVKSEIGGPPIHAVWACLPGITLQLRPFNVIINRRFRLPSFKKRAENVRQHVTLAETFMLQWLVVMPDMPNVVAGLRIPQKI